MTQSELSIKAQFQRRAQANQKCAQGVQITSEEKFHNALRA